MSIPRITGRQARELLDGTTPGPWWVGGYTLTQGDVALRSSRTVCPPGTTAELVATDDVKPRSGRLTPNADLELMAAAPDLAETVAWLYVRIMELELENDAWKRTCAEVSQKLADADNLIARRSRR